MRGAPSHMPAMTTSPASMPDPCNLSCANAPMTGPGPDVCHRSGFW
ncbi:hypothetical protein [Lysobacter gummosus]